LRVAVCAEHISAYGGGAELAVNHYIEGLSQAGIELTVLTSLMTRSWVIRQLSNLKAQVIQLPFRTTGAPDGGLLKATKRSTKKITEVFSSNDVAYVAKGWYPVAAIARKVGIPVVAHAHDYALLSPKLTFARNELPGLHHDPVPCTLTEFIEYRIRSVTEHVCDGTATFRRAVPAVLFELSRTPRDYFLWKQFAGSSRFVNHLVVVSEAMKQIIVEYLPQLRDRCSVIYNPLTDTGFVEPQSYDGLSLGYFGGPSYQKGFVTLLRSLKLLANYSPSTKIKLIAPDTCCTRFSRLVRKLGLENVVLELPRISHDELPRLYQRIDVVVVPSLCQEPLPYVALEAQLFGRPVIASEIGGLPEIVEHNETGWLFHPINASRLAHVLLEVANLPREIVHSMGVRARVRMVRKFADMHPIQKLISILEREVQLAK
jgi:glycosyltransferase involved in cell wall biosynthesis